ncbi:MAG: hypothetical protein HUU22_11655 [Phycisphaerae bacterium]|nr:hypothetical protein [Phycisphaerae bacterium]NUQ46677.1 hypothetical protein [Phycisphaerae bacterium]
MSRNSRRAERHRAKRMEKHRMMQRARSVSPYRRAAAQGEVTACYVNEHWRDNGMAAVFVLRGAPGRGMSMASYLVDIWCLGLKDAWGRLQYSRAEFDKVIERQLLTNALVRLDIETARRIVFGGIRFAKQNGFRLPHKYERWTAMLGPEPDPESLDMSIFGKDGKLFFVGQLSDLNERLIRSTPQEFVRRPDVEWALEADADSAEDMGEAGYDSAAWEAACDALVDERAADMSRRCRDWLTSRNQVPHPMLHEAWRGVLNAVSDFDEERIADLDAPDISLGAWQDFEYRAANFIDADPDDEDRIESILDAIRQAMAYMRERGVPFDFKEEYVRVQREAISSTAK